MLKSKFRLRKGDTINRVDLEILLKQLDQTLIDSLKVDFEDGDVVLTPESLPF